MAEPGIEALRHSVRAGVVFKHFGILCTALALLTCVPLAVSLFFAEYSVSLRYALMVLAVGSSGFLLSRLRAPSREMRANEALVVTAFIFVFSPLVVAFPLAASGIGYWDALFEAVSGITTTGLSTLGDVEGMPRSFLFARSWMQWVGGLGIVVLSLALIMRPGVAARRLADIDWEGDIVGGARKYARAALKVYLALTLAGALLLVLFGVGWYDSLVHALSAVSTGGFSSKNGSIGALGGWPARTLVIAFSLCGAVPLALYHNAFKDGWRALFGDVEVKALVAMGLGSAVLVGSFMAFQGYPSGEAFLHATLMAFSAQSTAGFSTLDVSGLGAAPKLVLVASMAVGGGLGSTGGGMKVFRVLIMLRVVRLLVERASVSRRAVVEPRIGGRRLESDEVERALVVVFLFWVVVFLSWLPFVSMGHDPLDSLFDIVSATATVGLSAGVAGPGLEPSLKAVLCVDMLMGRLEMFALLMALYPGTWFGRRA